MDLVTQEGQILEFWKKIGAFEKSVTKRPKSRQFVFYEGPPTANGRPGIHHVLARAYKDIICRYKTMQGYRVERKAGWDTHGLPVEIQVEKELGLTSKKDIETCGVAKFNEKCRESVWKYKQEWEKLTERIGFWIDLENPYITYDPLYMETLWWIIKQAYEKKLLYEGHKVVPYCPRCGTSLSSHEVALGYEDVTEDSVFVKFLMKKPKTYNLKTKTYLLAWTTTPWTLPGNVALAVGEKIDYVLVRQGEEHYILAKERLSILSSEYEVIKEFKGKELEGVEYEPLYDSLKDAKEKKHYVALADFVNTEEGTGIVHTAVMYGEDDYNLGQKLGLPKVHTVDSSGKFNERVVKWQGRFVKGAEKDIIADLTARNLLYKKEAYTHSYPFCWRCKTLLLYYAMQSWFIKMSALRAKLIKNNSAVNWVPAHIKEGRFGEWLHEIKDWNFSRARYWGTPLPIWRCSKCAREEVIGSREDVKDQKFSTNTFYVVRHGESEKNITDTISCKIPEKKEFHLTIKGRKQAEATARALKKLGGVDYIFSSDFTRTKETAEIIASALGAEVFYDKRLREYDLGVYEGRAEQDFIKDFPDSKQRFQVAPEGGEALAAVQQRMFDCLDSINRKYRGKKVLLVGHGDPMWILESRLRGLTIDEAVQREKTDYPNVGQPRKIEFINFPYNTNGELDLHRPYVDEIRFGCKSCKDPACDSMKRVEGVADVWFDSGSMPFASAPSGFPADYICEAIDQTRGWFYTLLAVSTVLGKKAPYKNVISLGHVLDKNGKKMSKSLGNTVDPWSVIEKYGADALRWHFFTLNQPGDPKNFDEEDLKKTYRKFISTLYNTMIFYKTYSSGKAKSYKLKAISSLDKWVLSRLNNLINDVTVQLDSYDVTGAARAVESFTIDDLSNWYVRRSRKRFQNPENPQEKKTAEEILAHVLTELCKLSAPFVPFLCEQIYQELGKREATSVHWENFPKANKKYINVQLEQEMARARKIVEIAHELRARAGIRVRQPLASLRVDADLPKEILDIIGEEVNVKEIKKGEEVSLDTEITPELKEEGFVNEFMRHAQDLRKKGGLVPRDKVFLLYLADSELSGTLQRRSSKIQKQNNATELKEGGKNSGVFVAEGEFEWEGKKVWVGVKKGNIHE